MSAISRHAKDLAGAIINLFINQGGQAARFLRNEHVNQISQRLICKSFHVIERLCGWLLMLHDRVKNNRLTLTQENVALLLGANRPTISVAAQNLRGKRLIDYSRGKFHLLDRLGLETAACECYSFLRTNNC